MKLTDDPSKGKKCLGFQTSFNNFGTAVFKMFKFSCYIFVRCIFPENIFEEFGNPETVSL